MAQLNVVESQTDLDKVESSTEAKQVKGTQVKTRAAKQARFVSEAKHKQRRKARRAKLVFILAAAVAIVGVGGSALFLLGRPRSSSAATPVLGPPPAAATDGHAPYPQVVAEDGMIRLPVSTFADGQARHYTYIAGDQPIELFVLRSVDGTVRAAFNACDVCFQARRGYVQDGNVMVCVNCGLRFPANQINVVRGGCNPAPLDRTVAGDMLVIKVADILEGARFF